MAGKQREDEQKKAFTLSDTEQQLASCRAEVARLEDLNNEKDRTLSTMRLKLLLAENNQYELAMNDDQRPLKGTHKPLNPNHNDLVMEKILLSLEQLKLEVSKVSFENTILREKLDKLILGKQSTTSPLPKNAMSENSADCNNIHKLQQYPLFKEARTVGIQTDFEITKENHIPSQPINNEETSTETEGNLQSYQQELLTDKNKDERSDETSGIKLVTGEIKIIQNIKQHALPGKEKSRSPKKNDILGNQNSRGDVEIAREELPTKNNDITKPFLGCGRAKTTLGILAKMLTGQPLIMQRVPTCQ